MYLMGDRELGIRNCVIYQYFSRHMFREGRGVKRNMQL